MWPDALHVAFVLAVTATNEHCSRLLFIPHAPKEGRKERRSFEGKQGGGQEGAEGRVWAGVAVRAVQPLREQEPGAVPMTTRTTATRRRRTASKI